MLLDARSGSRARTAGPVALDCMFMSCHSSCSMHQGTTGGGGVKGKQKKSTALAVRAVCINPPPLRPPLLSRPPSLPPTTLQIRTFSCVPSFLTASSPHRTGMFLPCLNGIVSVSNLPVTGFKASAPFSRGRRGGGGRGVGARTATVLHVSLYPQQYTFSVLQYSMTFGERRGG